MKNYKLILGSLFFIAMLALNVSVQSTNPFHNISLSEIHMVNANAEASDWNGRADVGCVECSQPGTVQYYCTTGSTNCFQTNCVGGMC